MNVLVGVVAIVPAALLLLDAANVVRVDGAILRWIVSGCAALLFAAAKRYTPLLLLILSAILFLFNPLFPIHFTFVNFKILEVLAIVSFAAAGLLLF